MMGTLPEILKVSWKSFNNTTEELKYEMIYV